MPDLLPVGVKPGSARPPIRGDFLRSDDALHRYGHSTGPVSLRPLGVARPVDQDDVGDLVRWAAAEGVSLTARGGGTGMPGGNVGPGVVVDLSGLDAMEAVDPEAGTVRVGAGVVADRVERAAALVGRTLPPLPSSSNRCSIGGMVANNAAGARSLRHGALRDWIVAVEGVRSDGSAVRIERGTSVAALGIDGALEARLRRVGSANWPDVRKNSSGYQLDRFARSGDALDLVPASEGTLLMVTAVDLRLAPAPEGRSVVAVPAADPGALVHWSAIARSLGAAACEFLAARLIELADLRSDPHLEPLLRRADALLVLEFEGSAETRGEALAALRAEAEAAGSGMLMATGPEQAAALWNVRRRASPALDEFARAGRLRSTQFIEDSVVPVGRLGDYLRGLERILADADLDAVVFGHAGDANVHVNPFVDRSRPGWREGVRAVLEDTAGLVAQLGGTLSGEHGDGRIRAPLLSRIWSSDQVDAFEALKGALDPGGLLNPGVVIPVPGQDPLQGLLSD